MRVYLKMMVLNLESQMQYKISFFMTVLGQFITAFSVSNLSLIMWTRYMVLTIQM